MGIYYVVGFSLIILFTILFYYRKGSKSKIGLFLLLIWFFASLFSVVLFFTLKRYAIFQLTVVPYVYLYIMMLISFRPFLKFDGSRLKNITANDTFLYYITLLYIIISILPLLENLLQVIRTFSLGNNSYYLDTYEMRREEDVVTWLSFIGRKFNAFCMLSYLFTPILFFYWLGKTGVRRSFKYLAILPTVNVMLYSLTLATRVALLSQMLYLFFLFLLFRNTLNATLTKKIKKIGAVVISVIVIFLFAISISRFDSSFFEERDLSFFNWFAIYGGESTLRFNADMWQVKTYMNGDNCFSFFKQIFGVRTFTNLLDRRDFWAPKTGIDGTVFYTFIGDFFGDFGPFYTLLLVLLVSKSIVIKRKNNIELHKIILFSTWYYICLLGFTMYPLKDYFGNQILLFNVFMFFITKFSYLLKFKRYDNQSEGYFSISTSIPSHTRK